uniref:Uncharacterized protein n=1 Tax=Helianthus annuus TaxID=4232 RepID=A0A251T2T0_HELAN
MSCHTNSLYCNQPPLHRRNRTKKVKLPLQAAIQTARSLTISIYGSFFQTTLETIQCRLTRRIFNHIPDLKDDLKSKKRIQFQDATRSKRCSRSG